MLAPVVGRADFMQAASTAAITLASDPAGTAVVPDGPVGGTTVEDITEAVGEQQAWQLAPHSGQQPLTDPAIKLSPFGMVTGTFSSRSGFASSDVSDL